ncbi:hypothetical protein FOXB_12031 [Fusarium oxysporum f. sp. conglutinans Fo5176]|uniref:Uncharacterized protein n=1 Tax=Fusarium oxysporum (strain Fo5176) TaxID=660025 RepID=F9G049_FUSOF|nr:hypothetical protein FOXB_12031 [Fusarium oxysporum f. sp. conglutinans Fo5176]
MAFSWTGTERRSLWVLGL